MPDTIFPTISTSSLSLSAAFEAVDRAPSSYARLRITADLLNGWGFHCVQLVLRDAAMAPIHVASVGGEDRDLAPDAMQPLPGVVWRRRVPLLEQYAGEYWYYLPGNDPWVAREFWAADPDENGDADSWGNQDLIVSLISGANGEVLGTAMMSGSDADLRPDREQGLAILSLLRHLGNRLSHDALNALAQRRAERLQRLQEAGAAMARSLDEREIVRELARQVLRATAGDGAAVLQPDLDQGTCRTLVRMVGMSERPHGAIEPLIDGVIASVARNGRALRSGTSFHSDLEEFPALSALDVMGEAVHELGPPNSVLAVPIMSGIRLLGVLAIHSKSLDMFSAEDEEVVATMASQAATAIANARRYAESERERRQTEALADVARAVGESLRPGEVMQLILRHAMALLQASGACIAIRQNEWLNIVAGAGAAELLAGVHVPIEGSLLGRAITVGGQVLSNCLSDEEGAYMPLQNITQIQNSVIAPLATANGIIGAMAVINRDQAFTDDDARILQRLGDQVSVAIVNARLFDEVERATREWKVAFDAVATGLAVLDESRRIVRCNRRMVAMCGRKEISELLGAYFPHVLLGDAVLSAEDDVVARSGREGRAVRGEMSSTRRGFVCSVTASPHPDGGTMVAVDDVTDGHKLAERYKRVVETALDAIIITDTNRRVMFANPAAHKLLGWTDSLEGISASQLVAPESVANMTAHESSAILGVPQRYECVIMRRDGEKRRVEVSTAPLSEVGQITGTVACLRDITTIHAREDTLKENELRWMRLVEEASDSIFTIDTFGRFLSVNRSLEEASGVPRVHLLGKICTGIVDPRDRALAQDTIKRTMDGERLQVNLRYPSSDGRIKVGTVICSPIVEDGKIIGGLGIMRKLGDEALGEHNV